MNFKNWDSITIILLIVSGLIIIFAFFSPYIFTQYSNGIDFTNTGQIGDTIGGIVSPFIALSGIILTFLAFYMQIKANQIQVRNFNESIENEKKIKLYNDKYNSFNFISLFVTDLEYIINDIKNKGERIKEYIDLESSNDLAVNTLFRTPSIHYSKILEIDKLEIYKGFNFFVENDALEKLTIYNKLYNILNFLPEFFKSIYDNHDNYSQELLSIKNSIKNDMNNLLDEASSIINTFHRNSPLDYLEHPEVQLCNNLIGRYYEVVDESYDEELNAISETDFNKISEDVLKRFIVEALEMRRLYPEYDRSIEKLLDIAAFLRKNINDAKVKKKIFVDSLKKEYNSLIVSTKEEKSILDELKVLREQVKTSLDKVDLNKL